MVTLGHIYTTTLRASDPNLGRPDHLREELDPSEMGYMRALERGFAKHVWCTICLSYLRFFSKLLDTGRSDQHFPTQFENL